MEKRDAANSRNESATRRRETRADFIDIRMYVCMHADAKATMTLYRTSIMMLSVAEGELRRGSTAVNLPPSDASKQVRAV